MIFLTSVSNRVTREGLTMIISSRFYWAQLNKLCKKDHDLKQYIKIVLNKSAMTSQTTRNDYPDVCS